MALDADAMAANARASADPRQTALLSFAQSLVRPFFFERE